MSQFFVYRVRLKKNYGKKYSETSKKKSKSGLKSQVAQNVSIFWKLK